MKVALPNDFFRQSHLHDDGRYLIREIIHSL